jgi:hypothetical protein
MGPKHVAVWILYKVVFDGYLFVPYMTYILFCFNFFILRLFNLMLHPFFCELSLRVRYILLIYLIDVIFISSTASLQFFFKFSPAFCILFHLPATTDSSTEKIVKSRDRTSDSEKYDKYMMKSSKCKAGQYAVLSKAVFYCIHWKIKKNIVNLTSFITRPCQWWLLRLVKGNL